MLGLAGINGRAVAADILDRPVTLNISPNTPLDEALLALGAQLGVSLMVNTPTVEHQMTHGVRGTLRAGAALTALLRGTGLVYSAEDGRILIVPASVLVRSSQRVDLPEANPPPQAQASQPALEEVVVTAEKREERLENVPISISVLSGGELDKATVQGVSEALNAVPGVATTETYLGGGTNIEIRGVGAAFPLFTGPSAVAYYLDSVPFGLVKSAVGPDANAYDLERVEVLRGPQGTLYGASALNGVVRILTNEADLNTFDFKARAAGSDTNDGSGNYRADATINVPIIEGKLAARATLGYEHNGGWIDQPNDKNANYTDVGTYRLKVNAQPTEELSIGLSVWRSHQNSGAPDLGHTSDENSSLLYQPTSTVYDAYSLKIGYQFPMFSVTSATSYLDYRNVGTLGLDVPGFAVPGSIYFSQLKSNIASEELNFNSSLRGPWRWSAGAIYRHGTEELFQYFTVLPIPSPFSVNTSDSYALYGELTRLFFGDRLEVTAGVRHFHDDLGQHGQTAPNTPFIYAASTAEANTPRVIATWHAAEHLMLYTSYSQGFRSGFPQETSVLVGLPQFPAVKPDRLRNYELGAKGSLIEGRLAFDASFYHMDWNDIQLLLAVPLNGVPYPGVVNGARASGNGIDLSLAIKLAEGLNISPYVSWNNLGIDGNVRSGGQLLYRDGDRPSGSPSTTAGMAASYAFPLGTAGTRGRLAASANYTSTQAYRTTSGMSLLVQDSNSILVCRLSFAVDFADHWTATLYGDNINNERGTTAVMFPGVVPDWQARLRPLTVGLQAEYHLH